MIYLHDTIAAVATAPGIGGIGIIRLSGPKAVKIVQSIFRPWKAQGQNSANGQFKGTAKCFSHQRMHYGYIVDPGNQRVVDEVLVAYMQAPHSYTREDVIEIQSHAGSAVLQAILSLVVRRGARLAEPGEFTRRAFINGRIDLTQAEAVADLIEAKTDQAMELATCQLTGGMKSRIETVRSLLEKSAAYLEAAIDFPEEVQEERDKDTAYQDDAANALKMIETLIRSHEEKHLYRDGIQVSVVGRPNVGKSSLLNALVQKERAIVTALPGTTRDVITDTFQVSGVPFEIADTAGMRHSKNLIEKLGIKKTEECIAAAHLILFVVDASEYDLQEENRIYTQIRDKKVLLVINKSDLVADEPIPPKWIGADIPYMAVSAKFNHNIEALKNRMVELMVEGKPMAISDSIVPTFRQKNILNNAAEDVSNALEADHCGESEEFIVFHLQRALNGLGTITGETHTEDLLDIIFNRFCIGK
jgi:tRNA modification GTPase